MVECKKIIGIDLEEIQNGNAVYSMYESVDGGENWVSILKSPSIVVLLECAKKKYEDSTPLVMQPHIQDIMISQIAQEIQNAKHSAAEQNKPKPRRKNWLWWILNFFTGGFHEREENRKRTQR